MHELSIAQMIVREVEAVAREHPGLRVKQVRLRLGALRAIEPASLAYCYSASASGTPAEGSTLLVESAPPAARCRACGARFSVERFVFICPSCGGADCATESGEELLLDSIEFDDAPSRPRRTARGGRGGKGA